MELNIFFASFLVVAISFATTFIFTPLLARKLARAGIVSPDMNKGGKPRIPKMGGPAIFLGFALALLISLNLYAVDAKHMLAALSSITLISFLGALDDIIKVRDIYRVILPAFAALPLMTVKAGVSVMSIPFLGTVNFDLGVITLPLIGELWLNLYALILIPIGFIACSNLVNLLGGFNGLEAGIGVIVSLAIGTAALILYSNGWATADAMLVLFSLFGACAAFLLFNLFPARIFPGNGTTYMIGAAIASAVIIGNMEKVGVIALAPQIMEFFLKARSSFKAENFGEPRGGRLLYYGKICSLTHLIMRCLKPTEKQLVAILLVIQAIFGALAVASIIY